MVQSESAWFKGYQDIINWWKIWYLSYNTESYGWNSIFYLVLTNKYKQNNFIEYQVLFSNYTSAPCLLHTPVPRDLRLKKRIILWKQFHILTYFLIICIFLPHPSSSVSYCSLTLQLTHLENIWRWWMLHVCAYGI